MPRCKHCREKFEAIRFNMKYCLNPECVKVWVDTEKTKQWKAKKTQLKKELMSLQDYLKIAQQVFNRFINLRDKNKDCISCNKEIKGVRHASHYLSAGGHSAVRFHEDNVWTSCYKCNVMLSGNQVEYRKSLINKIGVNRVEWLENNGSHVKKWTIQELTDLIAIYKQKSRELAKK